MKNQINHFDKLPKFVELLIMKELDLPSIVNMRKTCKKFNKLMGAEFGRKIIKEKITSEYLTNKLLTISKEYRKDPYDENNFNTQIEKIVQIFCNMIDCKFDQICDGEFLEYHFYKLGYKLDQHYAKTTEKDPKVPQKRYEDFEGKARWALNNNNDCLELHYKKDCFSNQKQIFLRIAKLFETFFPNKKTGEKSYLNREDHKYMKVHVPFKSVAKILCFDMTTKKLPSLTELTDVIDYDGPVAKC